MENSQSHPSSERASDTAPGQGSGTGQGSAPANAQPDDIIVFYCPSGHKLNAPTRLQGKAGQCPHCGEKFRIPSYEEEQVEEPVEELQEEEAPTAAPAPGIADLEDIEDFPETHEELEELQDEVVDIDVEADVEEVPLAEEAIRAAGPGSPTLPGHALAQVFASLWDRRGEEGSVDLYLAEGELLSPDFFSFSLSHTTHGVFADRLEDGTYTIVTVPWESVKKAVLTKVRSLPDGLFH